MQARTSLFCFRRVQKRPAPQEGGGEVGNVIARGGKGQEHREPEAALKLAHAEDELCLA